jgi:hypothetical protein
MKHLWLTFAIALVTANVWAAAPERAWQTGTWVDVRIVRPRISFGIGRDPRAGAPAPAVAEVRTYVIETKDVRLELKENTFADASHIDVNIGGPVTFALEKNSIYIRVDGGPERKLSVTKNIKKTTPRAAGSPVYTVILA